MVSRAKWKLDKIRGVESSVTHRTWEQQKYRNDLAKSLNDERKYWDYWKSKALAHLSNEIWTSEYELSKYWTDKSWALKMIDKDVEFFLSNITQYGWNLDKDVALSLINKRGARGFFGIRKYFSWLDKDVAAALLKNGCDKTIFLKNCKYFSWLDDDIAIMIWSPHDKYWDDSYLLPSPSSYTIFAEDVYWYYIGNLLKEIQTDDKDFKFINFLISEWCSRPEIFRILNKYRWYQRANLFNYLVSTGYITKDDFQGTVWDMQYKYPHPYSFDALFGYPRNSLDYEAYMLIDKSDNDAFKMCKKYNPIELGWKYQGKYAEHYPKEMKLFLENHLKNLSTFSECVESVYDKSGYIFKFKIYSKNEILNLLLHRSITKWEKIDKNCVDYLYRLFWDNKYHRVRIQWFLKEWFLKDEMKDLLTFNERIEFIRSKSDYIFKIFSKNEIIKFLLNKSIAEWEKIDKNCVDYLYWLVWDDTHLRKIVLKKFSKFV